ncbi:hypothetical protein Tco_0393263 [Tanacetum coccineum]
MLVKARFGLNDVLGSKGLRQWDPLSPFLFILAMEGLHAFTCKAEEIGLFKGASIGWDNMNISHLMRYPRGGAESSQFDSLQAAIENVSLSDQCDSWQWSLDVSVGYSVASLRALVDAHTLDVDTLATRWNSYEMAKDLWALLANWWELDILMYANILEWYVWLDSLHFSSRTRSFLEGVGDEVMVLPPELEEGNIPLLYS